MQLCLILSAYAGNHTIAVVKGMEDYKTISAAMHAPLMKLFILMQQTGFVNVNGNHYPIELFLSSDMKVGFVWFMEQPHVCVRTFSLYF